MKKCIDVEFNIQEALKLALPCCRSDFNEYDKCYSYCNYFTYIVYDRQILPSCELSGIEPTNISDCPIMSRLHPVCHNCSESYYCQIEHYNIYGKFNDIKKECLEDFDGNN